jgi:hypothetical protein
MASPECLPVPDTELSRPALVLAQRFVQRWDLHARQLDDGSYVCVHEQLNVGHLFAHLRGGITLGAYLLNQERSRRGGHLWLFLAQAVAGREVRAFGHGLLAAMKSRGLSCTRNKISSQRAQAL